MNEQPDAETFGTVTFWYRNYRGEISRRVAAILGLRWGSSEYHKEPQWLLRAIDIERNAEREFAVKDMAPTESALAQSDAEPKGIDLDDADRAYDKWAEHRNGQSRLDAFRAGVEFGLRHTAPSRPDASGLIEAETVIKTMVEACEDCDADGVIAIARTYFDRAADRSGKGEFAQYAKEFNREHRPDKERK